MRKTIRRPVAAFAVLGLAAGLGGGRARAQTQLGQPSLDEAKVQIWCAAVRYVYDDTGRPQLKSTLRCEGGNLAALAASLRPDSQRVYSRLYVPIEENGRIYRGLKNDPARLAALSKAIVAKLQASPARRNDPERLAHLQDLEKKLTDYVETGLPPGELSSAPAAEAVAADDPTAAPTPDPAAAAEATGSGAARAAASAEPASLLDRFFAPLALIFSLLSLALYALLRLSLGRELRQLRRAAATAGGALSPAQQQEVEELVARRVAEALQRDRNRPT